MTPSAQLARNRDSSGFTLFEMAMVITIIGLIVGAVLVGRDMIHAAELRSIYKTVQQFQTAINVFRDKYNGLPGDLRNATNFLTCVKVGTNFVGGFNASCNGDGNGLVNHFGSGGGSDYEMVIALEHLYRTELIAENREPDSGNHIVDSSVSLMLSAKTDAIENLTRQNSISLLGNLSSVTTGIINVGALSPKDAYRIDSKYDNGSSNTGQIRAVRAGLGSGNLCVGASRNYISAIDWTTEDKSCVVDFLF